MALRPAELTTHRRTIHSLTGIRLIAAIYVVVFHSKLGPKLGSHGHWILANLLGNGGMAVSLFFLLSGFILAYTYAGQINKPGASRKFWEARFARLWPVYIISLVLISISEHYVPKPAPFVAVVLMVQAWNPFDVGMAGVWNTVCWTLSTEAFFYLCFPFLQPRLDKLSISGLLGTLAATLVLIISFNLEADGFGYVDNSLLSLAHVPIPILRLPEFIAGVAMGNLYLMKYKTNSGARRRIAGLSIWTSIAVVATIALLCRSNGRWDSLNCLGFCALIYSLATEDSIISRLLSTRIAILGGGISYSLYLIQTSIRDLTKQIAALVGLQSEVALIFLMSGLLIATSYLLFRFAENPARIFLRSIFARFENRRFERA
jgi:peptidoglycan/LPS O-acetylase OafA/YrhL